MAFAALLSRLGELTLLDEHPQWKPLLVMRALKALPLACRPATRRGTAA